MLFWVVKVEARREVTLAWVAQRPPWLEIERAVQDGQISQRGACVEYSVAEEDIGI
jgi:hypothetical protein